MITNQRAAITKHGQNLLAIFPKATKQEPVALCKALRRLEALAHAGATASCNGEVHHVNGGYVFDFNADENAWDKFSEMVLRRVDKVLAFTSSKVPVFVNGDARGYALKIQSEWLADKQTDAKQGPPSASPYWSLHRDMGGYGIIAPEIDAKGN